MKTLAYFPVIMLALGASALGSAERLTITSGKKISITPSALVKAQKKSTAGRASSDRKSITFKGKLARLVVQTGPGNDMMSYRIQGLRNPTLMVNPGAMLHILFVNTDDDMFHSLRFTTKVAPFEAKMGAKGSWGSMDLPHKSANAFFAQEITVKVPKTKGTYSYVCVVAGHAAAGMFGTLIVR